MSADSIDLKVVNPDDNPLTAEIAANMERLKGRLMEQCAQLVATLEECGYPTVEESVFDLTLYMGRDPETGKPAFGGFFIGMRRLEPIPQPTYQGFGPPIVGGV